MCNYRLQLNYFIPIVSIIFFFQLIISYVTAIHLTPYSHSLSLAISISFFPTSLSHLSPLQLFSSYLPALCLSLSASSSNPSFSLDSIPLSLSSSFPFLYITILLFISSLILSYLHPYHFSNSSLSFTLYTMSLSSDHL